MYGMLTKILFSVLGAEGIVNADLIGTLVSKLKSEVDEIKVCVL